MRVEQNIRLFATASFCIMAGVFCARDVSAIDASYVVSIPANVSFTSLNQARSYSVSASRLDLNPTDIVHISMTSANGALKNGTSSIAYSIAYSSVAETVSEEIVKDKVYNVMYATANDSAGISTELTFTTGNKNGMRYSGKHSDNLTFTVSLEQKTMQKIAMLKSTFDEMPEQQLMDERDGKIYWVSKLADGNIWMTQNLDYSENGAAKMASRGVYYENGIGHLTGKYDSAMEKEIWDGTSTSNLARNAEGWHYADGSIYEWEKALLACPDGWKLPTAGDSNGEFEQLISALGTSSSYFESPFYATRNGYVVYSVYRNIGDTSIYWSGIQRDTYTSYALVVDAQTGFPTSSFSDFTFFSHPVRCIAE